MLPWQANYVRRPRRIPRWGRTALAAAALIVGYFFSQLGFVALASEVEVVWPYPYRHLAVVGEERYPSEQTVLALYVCPHLDPMKWAIAMDGPNLFGRESARTAAEFFDRAPQTRGKCRIVVGQAQLMAVHRTGTDGRRLSIYIGGRWTDGPILELEVDGDTFFYYAGERRPFFPLRPALSRPSEETG